MPITEEKIPTTCDRCDKESQHIVKLTNPDNTAQYVCWNCLARTEKRINVNQTWKRSRRA